MQTQPPKYNRTVGEKLRAFAKQINEGNKLGICSLLIVTGLAVTLAVMSQENTQDLSKEKTSEIRTEFQNTQIGKKKILIKPKVDDVGQENHTAWEYVKSFAIETTDTHIRTLGVIHSVETGEANPHAVITVIQNVSLPTMMVVPKGICTEEGWNIILKAKPNPEFANRWGYKIPNTLGVGTTPGSGTPIYDPKPEAPKPFTLPPTMPVVRTITDTKGRALEGTILSRTDASISFKPKGTSKANDIKLDMLSADDQAYIATLVDKKSVKPTVLFITNHDYDRSKTIRDLLTSNGFDVHIGIIAAGGYGKKSYNIPEEVAAITIKPIEVIDQFDAIHVSGFTDAEIKIEGDTNPFSILSRFGKLGKIVIGNAGSRMAKKELYVSKDDYKKAINTCEGPNGPKERAFTKIDKNFIFYAEGGKDAEDDEIDRNRNKLVEAIKAQLSK